MIDRSYHKPRLIVSLSIALVFSNLSYLRAEGLENTQVESVKILLVQRDPTTLELNLINESDVLDRSISGWTPLAYTLLSKKSRKRDDEDYRVSIEAYLASYEGGKLQRLKSKLESDLSRMVRASSLTVATDKERGAIIDRNQDVKENFKIDGYDYVLVFNDDIFYSSKRAARPGDAYVAIRQSLHLYAGANTEQKETALVTRYRKKHRSKKAYSNALLLEQNDILLMEYEQSIPQFSIDLARKLRSLGVMTPTRRFESDKNYYKKFLSYQFEPNGWSISWDKKKLFGKAFPSNNSKMVSITTWADEPGYIYGVLPPSFERYANRYVDVHMKNNRGAYSDVTSMFSLSDDWHVYECLLAPTGKGYIFLNESHDAFVVSHFLRIQHENTAAYLKFFKRDIENYVDKTWIKLRSNGRL